MIRIRIARDDRDRIIWVKASGHAEKGENISLACAAVSVLLRTYAHVLEKIPGLKIDGGASYEGIFELYIRKYGSEQERVLEGIDRFLLTGAYDVCTEYRHECELELT